MEITTICKVIICIGILQTFSLYHVDADDGILFQVPEMVEWSQAEQSCQKNNGTLFKPNETSLDVSLCSKWNFNNELWVAATYINVLSFESASIQSDSVIRCEMCTIGERCKTTCLYKGCWNRCRAVCKYIFEPYNLVLSDKPTNWTEAKQWCSEHFSEFGDKLQNVSSLFSHGYCDDICLWTRNVILVSFQTTLAHGNEPGECGILHNGTISFTSCKRYLQPLCERGHQTRYIVKKAAAEGSPFSLCENILHKVAKTEMEQPRPSFSEGNNSCILMNNTITYTTTSEASRSIDRINATIITSSTNGTSTVANEIMKRTSVGLNEELSSLFVPVVVTTSRNDLKDSAHKSDTGIIIGTVIGSVVFLMMTVIVIICFRRKLLQRMGKMKSKHDSQNMTMHPTDTTHKPIYPYGRNDVPLDYEPGPFDQLESKCEGSRSDSIRQKSNPGKSDYTVDPKGSNVNYATVNKNVNVNSSNLTFNIHYVSFDT